MITANSLRFFPLITSYTPSQTASDQTRPNLATVHPSISNYLYLSLPLSICCALGTAQAGCTSRLIAFGGRCALLIYVSHFDVVLIKLVLFLEDKLKSIRNRMTLETRFGFRIGDFNTLLRAGERARRRVQWQTRNPIESIVYRTVCLISLMYYTLCYPPASLLFRHMRHSHSQIV